MSSLLLSAVHIIFDICGQLTISSESSLATLLHGLCLRIALDCTKLQQILCRVCECWRGWRKMSVNTKREEKIRFTTIAKELSFLDCIPISLCASKVKGILNEALNPKKCSWLNLSLVYTWKRKGWEYQHHRAFGCLRFGHVRPFFPLIFVVHRDRHSRECSSSHHVRIEHLWALGWLHPLSLAMTHSLPMLAAPRVL